uniref:C2H2-type domain-containing protein n=1 Tax=Anopheles atroparvus TaxID=41427 RepID=A0A182IV82_ANOAO
LIVTNGPHRKQTVASKMRHNDPSSFDGVIDPGGVLLHPFCYVCNLSVLQDGVGFCQMFAEVENMISPAKILSDVLEIEINSELSHSQIVCVNCNMLCLEYQQLIQRAETIRIEMTVAYNRTVMKLTGLTEKDLKENEVASADSEEHLDSALQNFNKELVCNKTFNSRDNRNAHRYVHSDKKPFECVTCGSGFMRKSQLYAHMQKKGHLNETIVVNQPRISANDTLEYETEPIENEPATDELHPGAISKHEHDAETIETDEFYLQHADEQERAEHLLDQEVSGSTSTLGLIAKEELDDTSWANLIEED